MVLNLVIAGTVALVVKANKLLYACVTDVGIATGYGLDDQGRREFESR
jgi:hypothetical protein